MGWIMIAVGVVSVALSVYLNMQDWYKISSTKVVLNIVFVILTAWLIPHGYYILSHKNPIKQQSTAIKIERGKNIKIKDNTIKGFDIGIDARNVEDINTENNKIDK